MRYSLHLTTKCNLQCVYCYENEERKLGTFEATEDDIVKALELVPDGASLELLGGEPFLVMHLLIFAAERAREKNITDLIVTTNGMVAPGIADVFIQTYRPKLVVSIDPLRTVEQYRKGIDQTIVCENIERWKEYTDVIVNMTIHPWNVEEMETSFSIFLRSYGITTIHFGAVEEWFNKNPTTWNSYLLQGKRVIDSLTDDELRSISLQPWESLCYFDKEYIMKNGHEVLEIYHRAGERKLTNFEQARSILHEYLMERKTKSGIFQSLSPRFIFEGSV